MVKLVASRYLFEGIIDEFFNPFTTQGGSHKGFSFPIDDFQNYAKDYSLYNEFFTRLSSILLNELGPEFLKHFTLTLLYGSRLCLIETETIGKFRYTTYNGIVNVEVRRIK
jgi:hypothetical protein